jgi:hypothetical protein
MKALREICRSHLLMIVDELRRSEVFPEGFVVISEEPPIHGKERRVLVAPLFSIQFADIAVLVGCDVDTGAMHVTIRTPHSRTSFVLETPTEMGDFGKVLKQMVRMVYDTHRLRERMSRHL